MLENGIKFLSTITELWISSTYTWFTVTKQNGVIGEEILIIIVTDMHQPYPYGGKTYMVKEKIIKQ